MVGVLQGQAHYVAAEESAPLLPYTPLATSIPGEPGTTTYTDTNAASLAPLFYRVGVSEQQSETRNAKSEKAKT